MLIIHMINEWQQNKVTLSSISNFQTEWSFFFFFTSPHKCKGNFLCYFILLFWTFMLLLFSSITWFYNLIMGNKSAQKEWLEIFKVYIKTHWGFKEKMYLSICVCCRYNMCVLWSSKSWKGEVVYSSVLECVWNSFSKIYFLLSIKWWKT
jgi:hypothetical protein